MDFFCILGLWTKFFLSVFFFLLSGLPLNWKPGKNLDFDNSGKTKPGKTFDLRKFAKRLVFLTKKLEFLTF